MCVWACVREREHSLPGHGGDPDPLLHVGMLVLGDELDGPSASLRYGGVMLPREREKTDMRIE